MEREGPRQHPAQPAPSEPDPVTGGWAGSRWSTPAALRVVEDDWPAEPTAQRGAYDPTVEIRDGWRSITTGGRGGTPAPVAARVAVVLDALYWAYRDGDEVWVTARTSRQRPTGGVLHPVDKRCIRATAAACFKDLTGGREVASTSALAAAQVAWEGTAAPLGEPTWLRWGRDTTGGLWWDPGGGDDRCVKIDRDGWQVAERPGCWFRRPGAFPVMPLPEKGGDLDELWRFVPCEPADRPLVLAWMLAATQPDPDFAAGVLYLTGSEGTAKTTSAETIARVAGAPAQPARIRRHDDRDLLYAANAGWTLLLDNVSALDAEQSDLLCTLVTGFHETVRTLYTTADTTTLALRRPIILTSIGLPGLRPDLIQRMVPVRLQDIPGPSRRTRYDLSAELAEKLPGLLAGLLELLSACLAAEETAPHGLPRLADLGLLAARADRLAGTDTLSRLRYRQRQLTSEAVGDEDPFFAALRARVTHPWAGTAAELHRLLDPAGDLARAHRDWPTAKGVSARLDRHRHALTDAGWTVERIEATPGSGRGVTWALTPPG